MEDGVDINPLVEGCDWKPEVLIIDDQALYRDSFSAALRKQGIQCITAASTEEAQLLLLKHRKSLRFLLSDIELGGDNFDRTNGFDWMMRQAHHHSRRYFPDFMFASREEVVAESYFGMVQNPLKPTTSYPSFEEWQGSKSKLRTGEEEPTHIYYARRERYFDEVADFITKRLPESRARYERYEASQRGR